MLEMAYYIKTDYHLSSGSASMVVINLSTQQVIAGTELNQSDANSMFKFKLDNTTPIALAVIISPGATYKLNSLTFGKEFE